MIKVGWCWTGAIPELLVMEPEKLNKIKVERIIKKNITVSSLLKMRLNIFLKCSII